MVEVGIEDMHFFGGNAYLDVSELADYRQLNPDRFAKLLIKEKTVPLLSEDPITFAVNAAKPIIDGLSAKDIDSIELLITCTESGIDFGKSISTYVHDYLGLSKNCRMFELKQACYSGTAGFQMAVNFILSQTSPGAKALVIATDLSRHTVEKGKDVSVMDWSYAEPSTGAGAVALLVSEIPSIFKVDVGANGYYGYEVMDTCRPLADSEAGNADLSLLSYLDCCEKAFLEYAKRINQVCYKNSFQYLAFHTPFGGMVKGAHRSNMRKILGASPIEIDEDFNNRVLPGLNYCQRVGNIMGATVLLSLLSTICNSDFRLSKRIGCFSYGSGCCSEFYSGVVDASDAQRLRKELIEAQLDGRYQLTVDEYEDLLSDNSNVSFGTRNCELEKYAPSNYISSELATPQLFLKKIKDFHREYTWTT
ncbi:MAG: 3-hydroxy-3-methylglutaryl-ACP synthase [Blastopirellula sp.]|nr:MAG: 3-hydroxy-3-methylglutaryl-ACP synthase [Blastopirellula sp.]